jgi:threonine dehydrogenase-like Zn-dependent dehydrogenase
VYVSYVRVPQGVQLDGAQWFFTHVHLQGGPAPVRRFLPGLIELTYESKIDPGRLFNPEAALVQVAESYLAMDERRAIKALQV